MLPPELPPEEPPPDGPGIVTEQPTKTSITASAAPPAKYLTGIEPFRPNAFINLPPSLTTCLSQNDAGFKQQKAGSRSPYV
jgi:hypothetical protein